MSKPHRPSNEALRKTMLSRIKAYLKDKTVSPFAGGMLVAAMTGALHDFRAKRKRKADRVKAQWTQEMEAVLEGEPEAPEARLEKLAALEVQRKKLIKKPGKLFANLSLLAIKVAHKLNPTRIMGAKKCDRPADAAQGGHPYGAQVVCQERDDQ